MLVCLFVRLFVVGGAVVDGAVAVDVVVVDDVVVWFVGRLVGCVFVWF